MCIRDSVDGTILDSMPMWCSVGSRFLQKNGITPLENIDSQMITRTLEESAAIFHETYGISGTVPEIVGRIIDMVRDDYSHHLQCKPCLLYTSRCVEETAMEIAFPHSTDRTRSNSPCTVLRPGWRCHPEKQVPSYSIVRSRCFFSIIAFPFMYPRSSYKTEFYILIRITRIVYSWSIVTCVRRICMPFFTFSHTRHGKTVNFFLFRSDILPGNFLHDMIHS